METREGQGIDAPAEMPAPPEILGPSTHLLDQPFFYELREQKDVSSLLPSDLFLDPKLGWSAFVHLAAGPNWEMSNDPQAKDTLNDIRRKNGAIFNPDYTTAEIVAIGAQFHRYLTKNHRFCIPYIRKYQYYFSWNQNPRRLEFTVKTTVVPTYESYCKKMAEAEVAFG